jgi:uncharacterized membrane protein
MSEGVYATGRTRDLVTAIDRMVLTLARHWLLVVYAFVGLYIGLAALAPLLMAAHAGGLGQAIYRFYSFQCHQLPQRSYYLFGQMGAIQTYSLDQVLAQGGDPNNLRAFIGSPAMGFKLAIAQRLTAIYAALFLGGLLWGLFGRRLPRLGPLGYLLFVLPMALDGGSHMVSEVTRLGFRESNGWAVWLTGGLASAPFYAGTTIGTLNWLLRTLTGTLVGLGTAWFIFPYLAEGFGDIRRQMELRLRNT